jgi:hypothetical protein
VGPRGIVDNVRISGPAGPGNRLSANIPPGRRGHDMLHAALDTGQSTQLAAIHNGAARNNASQRLHYASHGAVIVRRKLNLLAGPSVLSVEVP